MITTEELQERLIAAQKHRGVTGDHIAKATGLSPSTISRIETGKGGKPDAETLFRLTDWLGIDIDGGRGVVASENALKGISEALEKDKFTTPDAKSLIYQIMATAYHLVANEQTANFA